MATDIVLSNISGNHVRAAMTTTAVNFRLCSVEGMRAVQLSSNVAWYYSSADAGATADDWIQVAAGQPQTLYIDSAKATGYKTTKAFWARTASGAANLHVQEVE